jgi:hypothetical protein
VKIRANPQVCQNQQLAEMLLFDMDAAEGNRAE